jgi:hypothetical protein
LPQLLVTTSPTVLAPPWVADHNETTNESIYTQRRHNEELTEQIKSPDAGRFRGIRCDQRLGLGRGHQRATGAGTISIAADKSVSGTVKTQGIEGTVAHIHLGAVGQAGPPIITLTKGSGGVWTVPAGAKLTDDQYTSFKAGNLYVNVHSADHPAGEIRGQLKP